jgi:hypothetical protein
MGNRGSLIRVSFKTLGLYDSLVSLNLSNIRRGSREPAFVGQAAISHEVGALAVS